MEGPDIKSASDKDGRSWYLLLNSNSGRNVYHKQ